MLRQPRAERGEVGFGDLVVVGGGVRCPPSAEVIDFLAVAGQGRRRHVGGDGGQPVIDQAVYVAAVEGPLLGVEVDLIHGSNLQNFCA